MNLLNKWKKKKIYIFSYDRWKSKEPIYLFHKK